MKELATTKIGDIVVREALSVSESAPLLEVVQMLEKHRRGEAMVVGADGRLLGIFTERDLVRRVRHEDHAWHATPVGDVMTADPQTLSAEDTLAVAVRRMERGTFRRMPIVDEEGRPTGILSIRDVLVHLAESFPQEFLNVPPRPDRKASGPWGG